MPEMVLPGTYIEVRPEGLIAPGQVTLGNVGVVGTAAKGPVGTPVLLGSYADAQQHFGSYDSWIDPASKLKRTDELSLVRALELVFGFGGSTVYAVRIAPGGVAAAATYAVASASGTAALLTAATPGTWADDGLAVNVAGALSDAYVQTESHLGSEATVTLKHKPKQSARNRVVRHVAADGTAVSLHVVYDGDPAPGVHEVELNRGTGVLTFGDTIAAADTIDVSYAVAAADAALVTLRLGRAQEFYTAVDGNDLVAQINAPGSGSAWATAAPGANPLELPKLMPLPPSGLPTFAKFSGGSNGEAALAGDYQTGLDALLNQPVHIVVAAGRDDSFGNRLDAHVQKASTDAVKRDRIAVVGPKPAAQNNLDGYFDALVGHELDSDRVIFVAPGIQVPDAASGADVTLSGAYAAAAFAGFLAGQPAQVSPTNKTLPVDGLEAVFDDAHLTQLVLNRVLALEQRHGFHIVKGITTTTGGAFAQITARRIVDYAKYGVRLAADPYIGLLNNDRVRGALRATLTGFLSGMVNDEMLESYQLSVTATRAEEIQGIVNVTMVLQPVFSIDFIKVTMVLQ